MPRRNHLASFVPHQQLALTLLGLGLIACTGDQKGAAPDTVAARMHSTLPAIVDSSLASTSAIESSEAWNEPFASMDAFDRVIGSEEGAEPLPAAGEDEAPSGQEVADMLVEQIFNDDNYEGNGNYLIPGSLVCPDIEVPGETTFESETIPDQECLDSVAQIEPRVHVEVAGDGLDFALLVGPQKYAFLSVELRSASLALATDLAQVKLAAQHVAQVLNEESDLPSTMAGVLAATLTLHAPQDVSLAFSIREELAIGGSFPGIGLVDFSSAAADPLAEVRVDGAAQSLIASLDLGRTFLSMPWSAVDAESSATGTFAMDWQGLSTQITLSSASDAIPYGMLISNIGLGQGPSTIKLDEFNLVTVDLNKDNGRVFDLIMTPGAAGQLPVFRVDPGFDLEVGVDLSPLANAGDEVPDYFLGEIYRLEVESAAQPVAGATESGLKAIDGAIRLSSTSGTSIEVVSGQCLVSSEPQPDQHQLLGSLSTGPCPL